MFHDAWRKVSPFALALASRVSSRHTAGRYHPLPKDVASEHAPPLTSSSVATDSRRAVRRKITDAQNGDQP